MSLLISGRHALDAFGYSAVLRCICPEYQGRRSQCQTWLDVILARMGSGRKGPILNEVKLKLPPRWWSKCKCTNRCRAQQLLLCLSSHSAFAIDQLKRDTMPTRQSMPRSHPAARQNRGQALRVSPTHPKHKQHTSVMNLICRHQSSSLALRTHTACVSILPRLWQTAVRQNRLAPTYSGPGNIVDSYKNARLR